MDGPPLAVPRRPHQSGRPCSLWSTSSVFCSTDKVTFANGQAQDVGFASPILYGIAANATAYAASFNNVTVGNNDIYGLDDGLVFPARKGYNMATGLGSPSSPARAVAPAWPFTCASTGQTSTRPRFQT